MATTPIKRAKGITGKEKSLKGNKPLSNFFFTGKRPFPFPTGALLPLPFCA